MNGYEEAALIQARAMAFTSYVAGVTMTLLVVGAVVFLAGFLLIEYKKASKE